MNEWSAAAVSRAAALPSWTPPPPPPCASDGLCDGGGAGWLCAERKWLAHMLLQPSKANSACSVGLSCCRWATCANACPTNVGSEVILGHNIPATMCHHDHRQGCHVFIYEPDSTIQGQLGSNSTTFSSSSYFFFTFFIVIIIFFLRSFKFIANCSIYQTGTLYIHMNMMFHVMYTYILPSFLLGT